jgi:hypothetical protein
MNKISLISQELFDIKKRNAIQYLLFNVCNIWRDGIPFQMNEVYVQKVIREPGTWAPVQEQWYSFCIMGSGDS